MYQACYYLPSIHSGMPDDMLTDINAAIVTGLALADTAIIERYPNFPRLYDVRPEYRHPRSGERWKDVWTVLHDGWGDCKDFVAWRLAELWLSGINARAESSIERHRYGRMLFHTYIVYPNGAIEDPSIELGMR
jgi:hypothetical protein